MCTPEIPNFSPMWQVPEGCVGSVGGGRRIQTLRPRLLALQLLATVLPALDTKLNREYAAQVRAESRGNGVRFGERET